MTPIQWALKSHSEDVSVRKPWFPLVQGAQVCTAVFTNNSGQPRGPDFPGHLLGRLEAV